MVYSILFADPEAYRGFGGGGGRRGGSRFPQPRSQSPTDGKKILQRLSMETGGGFFEVSKKDSIEHIYSRIQEELRSQYSLGYSPDRETATSYHKIRLTAKQKGLVIQAREGYYSK